VRNREQQTSKAYLEELHIVRYTPGQHFDYHYDWFYKALMEKNKSLYPRLSSFFVILDNNCTGGFAYFLRISPLPLEVLQASWCDYIACDEDGEGLAFKLRSFGRIFSLMVRAMRGGIIQVCRLLMGLRLE
jgi:hypothetical protein